jgi:hypothetical protein
MGKTNGSKRVEETETVADWKHAEKQAPVVHRTDQRQPAEKKATGLQRFEHFDGAQH